MVPSPKTYHQRVSRRLEVKLSLYTQENDLGEVFDAPFDVVLSEETVLQPDILFVSKERSHIITEDNIQGAPDLVIEILSQATEERDRTWKKSLYAKHGVGEYWLADLKDKTVEVLQLGEGGYQRFEVFGEDQTLKSPIIKGLQITLSEVF